MNVHYIEIKDFYIVHAFTQLEYQALHRVEKKFKNLIFSLCHPRGKWVSEKNVGNGISVWPAISK